MAAPNVTETMNALLECVCAALDEADRPVCACGLTVGPPVIGPGQCCKCTDGTGDGQVSAHLERMYPADGQTLEPVIRFENCRPGAIAADIAIVVVRCYPRITSTAKMPTLDETTVPSENLNLDMGVVWKALMCCGNGIVIRESAVESDPDGGCSSFGIRVTVPVSLDTVPVVDGS